MEAFNIQSNDKELIIRMSKSEIPTEILLKIIQRLRVEYLAQKAGIQQDLSHFSEEIDKTWWEKNSDEFLKDVQK